MTEDASDIGRVSRTSVVHVIVLVIVGTGVFAVGYLSAGFIDKSPQDPALGLARDTGHAIPLEQYWAFEDGVIATEEVVLAGENFGDCVRQAGVEDFVLTVSDNGWDVTVADNAGFAIVANCQRLHFQAIWDVHRYEELPTDG